MCGYNWKSWRTRLSVTNTVRGHFLWCLSVATVITGVHSLICQCKCARHPLINRTFGHRRSSLLSLGVCAPEASSFHVTLVHAGYWVPLKIQSSVLYVVLYIEMNGLAIWTCNSLVNYRIKLQLVLFMKHHRATWAHPKPRQMIHVNKVFCFSSDHNAMWACCIKVFRNLTDEKKTRRHK